MISARAQLTKDRIDATVRQMLLIVDDDLDTREAYEAFFEVAGFETRSASNAEEAMQIVGERTPETILLDVTLGGTSGLELRRSLLNDPATRDIPVVAVTGHDLSRDERALFARVLRKPVDLEGLVTWLKAGKAR